MSTSREENTGTVAEVAKRDMSGAISNLVNGNDIGLIVPTKKINVLARPETSKMLATIAETSEELQHVTTFFDRQNSATTISMQTLTMLGGQSPHRMIRQCTSTIQAKKHALAEAQVNLAKSYEKVDKLKAEAEESETPTRLQVAKLSQALVSAEALESKVFGAIKDIAQVTDLYNKIKDVHGIDNMSEADFEESEKRHAIRRGFELLYRDIIERGRGGLASLEYLQQFGVHPQVAILEVTSYVKGIEELLKAHMEDPEKTKAPIANDLENFLDAISERYAPLADTVTLRMFGERSIINDDYCSDSAGLLAEKV